MDGQAGREALAGLPDLAVVLTGGTGRRLGGADKAGLVIGGRTLLDRALDLLSGVRDVVVVGPEATGVSRPGVHWAREDPPGGGPAAGVLAGLALLDDLVGPPAEALVLVLAVDMPRATEDTLRRLTAAAREDGSADGALLVDSRRQFLCAAYGCGALRGAAPAGSAYGMSMRDLVGGLRLVEVPAVDGEGADLDTWEDVERARDL